MKAVTIVIQRLQSNLNLTIKIMTILLFSLSTALASAQIPKGFNYQAIAFDNNGDPIRNQALPVRITIQSDSLGGTIFWHEEHTTVNTNQTGMFSLVIGTGTKISGTAAMFADIDWSVTPKFIRTDIDYEGWKTLGSSRLWSIPYAMAAGDLTGTLRKLEVAGSTESLEEALFEVRNKNGEVVFAVYNEGVRVYVGNGGAKASKSGFAIGSFDRTKGGIEDLFVINRDSVRIYLDESQSKAIKGGFAIGSFDRTKGTADEFLRVTRDSTRIYLSDDAKAIKGGFAIGSFDRTKGTADEFLRVTRDSTRIYLDDNQGKAIKGGFAIGSFDRTKASGQEFLRVTDDSIRMYINDDPSKAIKGGFAIGSFDRTKAPGKSFFDISPAATPIINPGEERILWYPIKNAFLAGRVLVEAPANVGENSMAMGYETRASGNYSQAFGYRSQALGDYSTAIGKNAIAYMSNSFAFGDNAIAGAVLKGNSYAFGKESVASGSGSYALGYRAVANVDDAFAFGSGATAAGAQSFAFGSVGLDSLGNVLEDAPTFAGGDYSIAMGLGARTDKKGGMSFGVSSKATEEYSLALGYGSIAQGINAVSVGSRANYSETVSYPAPANLFHRNPNNAKGHFSVAIGMGNTTEDGGTAIGLSNVSNGSGSVSIGFNNTADALRSFAAGYRSKATGKYAVAIGNYTEAQSYSSFVVGSLNKIEGNPDAWVETDPLFVVGNGENRGTQTERSNAFVVYKNGNAITYGSHSIYDGVNAKRALIYDTVAIGLYRSAHNSIPYLELKENRALGSPSYSYSYNMIVSGKQFRIRDSETVRFSINESGYVGIGTTAPTKSLDINGQIRIRGGSPVSGRVLISDANGVGSWGNPSITNTTGTLTVNRGGTGRTSLTTNKVLVGNGTGSVTSSPYLHWDNTNHYLGVGVSSPEGRLHVGGDILMGSATNKRFIIHTHWTGDFINITSDNTSGAWEWEKGIILAKNGNVVIGGGAQTPYKLRVTGSVYAAAGYSSSDRKFKDDIRPIGGALSSVMAMEGVTFSWRNDEYPGRGFPEGRHYGVIAQQIEEVLPEVVMSEENDEKSVSYTEIIPVLIEAMKEQQKQIETVKEENTILRSEMQVLREELTVILNEVKRVKTEDNTGNRLRH